MKKLKTEFEMGSFPDRGYLDSHLVIHAFDSLDIPGELGDKVLLSQIRRFSADIHNAILRFDMGWETPNSQPSFH